jgi:DNA polymerase III alpha subunit (gram-positive type)
MVACVGSREDAAMDDILHGTCPSCRQGELITITMTVNGSDLDFTTCHMCEAKWWYRDGAAVPLTSVIGDVISQRA